MNKVLIINHNSSANSMLKSRLQKEGLVVKAVENGEEGIRAAREEHYRLILIDYHLPKISGPDVCYVLKHGINTRQSKIVYLSPENEEESSVRSHDVCSDGFISSLGNLDDIISSIKKYIIH